MYLTLANLDELVPPVFDRERWWYKLTQASRPPLFPPCKDDHRLSCLRLDELTDYMHMVGDNLMGDGKSREHTFSVETHCSEQLD